MPLTKATQAFISQVLSQGGKSILAMSLAEFREMQRQINASLAGPEPTMVHSQKLTVGRTQVNIHQPDDFHSGMPTLLYVPGGAFVTSGFDNLAPKRMARVAQIIVINHRLAPEFPLPASIDDIENAILDICNHKESLNINEKALYIGGDSSGAGFVLAACLRMRDKKTLPELNQLIFISPAVDLSMAPNSFAEFDQEDKLFGDEVVTAVQQWYAPDCDLTDPEISPLYHRSGFADLPPVSIIIPEYDRLRSQAHALKEALEKNNVSVTEHVCTGQIHASLNLRGVLNDGEDPAEVVAATLSQYAPSPCFSR